MPTVHLHIGARKSGTTFLQLTLRKSRRALAGQRVRLAATTQDDFRAVVPPLRQGGAGDVAAAHAGLDALLARLREQPALDQIVTLEALAELPGGIADSIVAAIRAEGFDVRLVVTARPWGKTIPSEWQQTVKQRGTRDYAGFVSAIRDRKPAASLFLRRQDLPDIVRRWTGELSPADVRLIACPPSSRTEGTIVELFCGVVGVDPASLTPLQSETRNSSLSLAQAEMLRRMNLALGDRLSREGRAYQHAVREWVTGRSLSTHERAPILLPDGFAAWCADETRRQLDELTALGVEVIGRPEDLLTPADAPTGPAVPPEEDVSAVAVTTVADLAALRWQELTAEPAAASEPPRRSRWRLGRR